MPYIHEIKCSKCSIVCGSITFADQHIPKDKKIDNAYCGIVDHRCDNCSKKYGTYQEEQQNKLNKK